MRLGPIRVVRRGDAPPPAREGSNFWSKRAALASARREARAEEVRLELARSGPVAVRLAQDMRAVGRWPAPRPDPGVDPLALRLVEAGDRNAYLASIDEEVRFWQGIDDRRLSRYERMFDLLAAGELVGWIAQEVAVMWDGGFAGTYSIAPSPIRGVDVELGGWLDPAYRGRGLGHISLAAVLDHAHHAIGAAVVRIGTTNDNVRVRRLIEAAGAVLVEEVDHTLPDGRVVAGRRYHHRADLAANRPVD